MTVDLSPAEDLDLDQELLDFAPDNYCANCVHFQFREADTIPGSNKIPYCQYWEEETVVEAGLICPEYVPQGYE